MIIKLKSELVHKMASENNKKWCAAWEYTPENDRRGEKWGWLRAIKVPDFSSGFRHQGHVQHYDTTAQAGFM
jgi:hypothetical protein